jgi:hypothetical protein
MRVHAQTASEHKETPLDHEVDWCAPCLLIRLLELVSLLAPRLNTARSSRIYQLRLCLVEL